MDKETADLLRPLKEAGPDPNSPLGRLAAACKRAEEQASTDLTPDPLPETVDKAQRLAGEKTVTILEKKF